MNRKPAKTAEWIGSALQIALFIFIAAAVWNPINDRLYDRPTDTSAVPPHRLNLPPNASPEPAAAGFGYAPVIARLPQPDSGRQTIALRWDQLDTFRSKHPEADFRLAPGDGRVETGKESGYDWSAREQADGLLVVAHKWQETADFASRYLVRDDELRLLHHDQMDAMGTMVAFFATAFAAGVGTAITSPILLALWRRRRALTRFGRPHR